MRLIIIFILAFCLTGCGFHARGPTILAPSLYKLYLQTPDPYGELTRTLTDYLKVSGVHMVDSPEQATAILAIIRETPIEQLLGISGTQQTRLYNLILTVTFTVNTPAGKPLTPPQTLSETRTLTIMADQILAGSNEANNLFQQMRPALVYDIMSRLSSVDITTMLTTPKTAP